MAKKSSGDKSSAAPPKGQRRSALMSVSPLPATSPKRKVISPFETDVEQSCKDASAANTEGVNAPPAVEVSPSRKLSVSEKLRLAAAGAMSSANLAVPALPSTVISQTVNTSDSLEDAIDEFAQRLSALPRDKLLAGLSVLARDLDELKGELPPREAFVFATTFEPIITEDRLDNPNNTILNSKIKKLPSGIAKRYSKAKSERSLVSVLTLETIHKELSADTIVNEETIGTGERMLGKFMRKCKDVICGKGGPYETFVKKSAGQKALAGKIGAAIVGFGLAASSPLVPLTAYCAVLLAQVGLKTLCED